MQVKLCELTVGYLVTTHAHASKAYKAALRAEEVERPPWLYFYED